MPCYTVNLVSVEFQAKHIDLLESAAKSLGWSYQVYGNQVNIGTVQIDLKRGIATSYSQSSINKLKQEYSMQAVQLAAKKQKWFIKKKTENKVELRRY